MRYCMFDAATATAIAKVPELIGTLIKTSKDRETQSLVQEIQTHQLVLHTALISAYAKLEKLESDHSHAITAIREDHRLKTVELDAKIAELQAQLSAAQRHFLDDFEHIERTGLYRHKTRPGLFCGRCTPDNKFSLVQTFEHGWKCRVCNEWFNNPDNPPQITGGMMRSSRFPII
jgi:hypothetical protein